jgi:hypothetical protein
MNATDILNSGNFRGFSLVKNLQVPLIRVSAKRKLIEYNSLETSQKPNDFVCFLLIHQINFAQSEIANEQERLVKTDLRTLKECKQMGMKLRDIVSWCSHFLLNTPAQAQRLEMMAIAAAAIDKGEKVTVTALKKHAGIN